MRVHGKRALALATVAAMFATSVIGTFSALAATSDELTAAGYSKADGLNVHLADNEYYKEISNFEAGSGWTQHAYTPNDAKAELVNEGANSGTGALKMSHGSIQGPASAVINVANLAPGSISGADKATYLQFYAENTSDAEIEIAKLPLNGAGAANTQQADATKETLFLDLENSQAEWTKATTKAAVTKLDGNNYEAIIIPAGAKGLFRVPLTAWGSPAEITRVMLWTHGAKNAVAYFDDLGLVAVAESGTTPAPIDKNFMNINKANADKVLEREDEFTPESFAIFKAEYDKVAAMPETTQAEVDAKASAYFNLMDVYPEKKPVVEEIITEVPEGYTQEPATNVPLTEKEFYKELTGFEALNTDWEVHAWTKGEVISSAEHKNSGNACVSATSKSVIGADGVGQEGHRNVFQVKLTGDKQDFSKAKYLQFYVENNSSSDMEFSKIALDAGGLKGQLQNQELSDAAVLGAEFLDMKSQNAAWAPATMAFSSPRLDNPAMSGRFATVVIPAGAKGMVRIPLTAWGGAGDLKAVARVQLWTFIRAGETAPATLYVDDLGLVGVLGEAAALATKDLEAAKDAASKKVEKDYTAESWTAFQNAMATANEMPETTQADIDAKTAAINAAIALLVVKPIDPNAVPDWTDKPSQNVYLNPGEEYKYIAGGEDNDINKIDLEHTFTRNQITLVPDAKNSGTNGIKIMQTNGDSQNAFHTVFAQICAEQKDWSDAKYLTFWVQNDQANAKAVLELFYIQARTAANDDLDLIDYDMQGIKFFDQRTGEWSDLEVLPNKQHRLPGEANPEGTYDMVPSLQIPANAKGLVRIPLTNVDSEDLTDIVRFQIFMATSGATGIYYVDDIGLVTYEGDTAPEYVNGKGDGTTPGGGDEGNNDDDDNGDGPTFEWGDDDENDDNNDDDSDAPAKTGVTDWFAAVALLLIAGCGVCVFCRKKSSR